MQKLIHVCKALRNPKIVDFVHLVLEKSYKHHIPDHSPEVEGFIERLLNGLVESQAHTIDILALKQAGKRMNQEMLREHTYNLWFRKSYMAYRSNAKVKYEYSIIQNYLIPGTILDFGSGDGYFAELLTKNGFSVWGTDIRDYRSSNSKDFHFSLMSTPFDLESVPDQFHTTIVKSVLHHIDPRSIDGYITLLRKKTLKRLIIKEELLSLEINDIQGDHYTTPNLLSNYLILSPEEQLQYLALMDFMGNYVVQGLFFINLPFSFRSLSDWQTLLKERGFSVIQVIPQMFDIVMFHPGPHVWLICDVGA